VTRTDLDDERGFLLASLEDLEREHAAGDLSDADYEALRDRYTRRAADVLRELDAATTAEPEAPVPARDAGAPQPSSTRARRRHLLAVVGGLAVLVAVSAVVVETQTGSRLPGQTATGSVSLSKPEQIRRTLAQAETLETSGDAAGALHLYHQVLAQEPDQVDALAESGWLEFEAGAQAQSSAVLTEALQLEQRAQRSDPGAYAPHLYLGSMLLAEGNAPGAVTQYRQFLADGPPQDKVVAAKPFIARAFTQVGQPVPAMPTGGSGS